MVTRGWLSVHIFWDGNLDFFLCDYLKPLLENFKGQDLIKEFFFIRYWEDGQHLRVRFRADQKIIRTLITRIKSEIKSYKHLEDISTPRVVESKYVPELDRYGGANSIELAECLFVESSGVVLEVLESSRSKWDDGLARSIAMQMHLLLLKENFDQEEVILLLRFLCESHIAHTLNSPVDRGDAIAKSFTLFDNSFQEQQQGFVYMCKELWQRPVKDPGWRKRWSEFSYNMASNYRQLENERKIEKPNWLGQFAAFQIHEERLIRWTIWGSYLHMINNKLGVMLRDEAFIYYSMSRALSNILNEENE